MTPDKNWGKLGKDACESILSEVVLARIGTVNPNNLQPHVVPVWFEWDGTSIWISAFDSTRKVKDLKRNPMISILIETGKKDIAYQAVLLEGRAEVIKDRTIVEAKSTSIYQRYLGPQGVLEHDPQSWIIDPENTIIKLTPSKIYSW